MCLLQEQYCTVTNNYNADWADVGYHEVRTSTTLFSGVIFGDKTWSWIFLMFPSSFSSSISSTMLSSGECSASGRQHDCDGERNLPCSGNNVPGENKKWVECLPAICSYQMCSWGPIFAHVLISGEKRKNGWMRFAVIGCVRWVRYLRMCYM